MTPSFLQAKFSSGAKIISNLKQSLSRNFPGKVFNNQLELIQGFGSLITYFFFCNTPKIKVQWIQVRAFWGPRKVVLAVDNYALELVLKVRKYGIGCEGYSTVLHEQISFTRCTVTKRSLSTPFYTFEKFQILPERRRYSNFKICKINGTPCI